MPRSKANFTDAHGTPHPTWAKPFFAKEFKNFDEVFKRPENSTNSTKLTSAEIYHQFVVPDANCLNDCYKNMVKH